MSVPSDLESSSLPDYSIVHPVPGVGRPLDYVPKPDDPLYIGEQLPTALLPAVSVNQYGAEHEKKAFLPITTVREFVMLQFMNSVTDKPDWVFNPEIIEKWRSETVGAPDLDMTTRMFDYCIAELQHIATHVFPQRQDLALVVYNGNVVKSDSAIASSVKVALQDAVKRLENVHEKNKDWHPDSDEMVLDLVHPSLFPLIYGRTRVLKIAEKVVGLEDLVSRCGEGEALVADATNAPAANVRKQWGHGIEPYSLKYQWLPCEVDISGSEARITSYINNLHPKEHADLYRVIEQVIVAAIPLWELTLAPLYDKDYRYYKRIPCDTVEYGPLPAGLTNQGWNSPPRPVIQPEPGSFDAQNIANTPRAIDFKEIYGKQGRPLQIIVKLANIELTPEKWKYEGGSWHVEGQQNEHICATALYYYSSDNIKSSQLAFRQFVDSDSVYYGYPYQQDQHQFLEELFGCQNGMAGVQDVGKVETREGRLLTFPNILQHQVQPFELEDPMRNGHRKILALFLVDPNVRVASTAYVPSQRLDWWQEAAVDALEQLPFELKEKVFGEVDGFPITLSEAKEIRLDLMKERGQFVTEYHYEVKRVNSFSLCEH
ncbi:hypothetical protein EST38_g7193 [Candolleomyces aberdarensis]|uniref:Uncharacterized protein n=1 Tax=Candolleomyces aberdarensis TaxID=2316362 RepID=A0A4Q2DFR1_9AGAR|nr:hypothetical protein EST38_g7193 [Candolleomyces aberdarensis]